ncbi:MAG: heme o synthase [Armatimonadota bacterium]|nr:heme o synthase [Armatimonadota bacterium]MDW8156010.1 heme o synthase [Armatimonadota bacterium]
MDAFRRSSAGLLALSLALVVLGGVVRTTGAGDACPDWPLCHGRWIPPLEPLVLLEWTHRLVAAVVGLWVAVQVVWSYRLRPELRKPAWAALGLVVLQALLGGVTVLSGLEPWLVVLHLGTALLFVAAVVVLWQRACGLGPVARDDRSRAFRGAVLAALLSLYVLILLGGYVGASGAGLACPDWPLCRGAVLPPPERGVLEHFAHRLWAVLVAVLLGWLVVRARQDRPDLRRLAHAAAGLYGVQIFVGWLNLLSGLHFGVVSTHLGLAAVLWVMVLVLLVRAGQQPESAAVDRARPQAPRWRVAVSDYVALTKPRIVVLLLVTTACTLVVAERGRPSALVVLATLVGGALTAGAANALNCVLDRDVDAVMQRTRDRRPVAAGRISPARAVAFAAVLGAVGFWVLWRGANLLAATLAVAGLVFYVLVYTAWLKRTTPQNIVIGGAAGAVPPLVAWAAVTGRVELPALLLFAVVFLWTPPHFWTLSLNLKEDYAAARIPMLPVVRGEAETRRQVFLYTVATVLVTLLMVPTAELGGLYASAAAVLGGGFLRRAWALWRGSEEAWSVYRYSLAYLALLFGAMVADRLVFGV